MSNLYQDETLFAELFWDLLSSYSSKPITDFLQSSFLLPENDHITTDSFHKIIYIDGDPNETYTKMERDFIDSFKENIYSYKHTCIENSKKNVECRIIVAYIDDFRNELYNSILFMKVINKAFDGFNSFVFINKGGIRIGCSLLNSERDCMISPLITKNIRTEFLFNIFLYRNISDDFQELYFGYLTMIDSLKYCFFNSVASSEKLIETYSLDDNLFEDNRYLNINDFIASIPSELIDEVDDYVSEYEHYLLLVDECFDDLSTIKKNPVNSLEILFESEKALEESLNQQEDESYNFTELSYKSNEDFDLLNDPLLLLKKLKEYKGIT